MNPLPSSLVCSACGYSARPEDPYPFRCQRAVPGDDVDHVMVRALDASALSWPAARQEENPFVRYRSLLRSYHLARAGGIHDQDYCGLVARLDGAVAGVDEHGFRVTPFARAADLSARLAFGAGGGVWVKDETGNVSGSHKARHLMGVALHLMVAARLGLTGRGPAPLLAIASCGNAALAAAVVARAAGRSLEVFVPTDADPAVISRLRQLGARITLCPREDGEAGDPTYRRLRDAVEAGALPFTCQGNENGLVIEGGETLGWEMVTDLRSLEDSGLDRVIVQVGGGALASAVFQSFREAVELGGLSRLPRVDTVQTRAAYPLKRAYDRLATRWGDEPDEALRYAATHRSEFMWPWEQEPHSVAHGILDDETYDWRAVVAGMLATGGSPIVVEEALLEQANSLAQEATGVDVDHTGSAGLAGLLALLRRGEIDPAERVAVLFTGVRRA